MVSSKQTRPLPLGLCRQCESAVFGTNHGDYANNPPEYRSVFCYSCGLIRVNAAGECMTKCSARHNWSLLDHLIKFLNSGYTPKRLSE